MVANLIVAQLLYLSQDDPEREIQMYINSPGGQIDAGLGITKPALRTRVTDTSFRLLIEALRERYRV